MNLLAINILEETIHALKAEHDGRAVQLLDQAKAAIVAPVTTWSGRPEDDPSRSPSDRSAWRAARGGR